ncbi:roadblock/LC7 domain-containing protein [Streptomyces sp.]|uniref:roadblock/LC7 domain-containing protein n=1 Tax=Streptomyces sp. TaxID=1931 RepID=UPI002D774DA3|nr:roadblock/LC7 domain-containing protein [Streptomyces sp.]HET6353903.1 roadblock/LC7 domain-containing protein [Streptomyces sp.]
MAKHSAPSAHPPLDLLLTHLADQVADVRHALVVSQDGMVVSKSTSLARPDAERLAATVSGLMSLGRSVCTNFDGEAVVQTLIEMRQGYLILTSAGRGAYLTVLCTSRADIGVVAFEMNLLVTRMGDHLGTPPRHTEAATASSGDAPTA